MNIRESFFSELGKIAATKEATMDKEVLPNVASTRAGHRPNPIINIRGRKKRQRPSDYVRDHVRGESLK